MRPRSEEIEGLQRARRSRGSGLISFSISLEGMMPLDIDMIAEALDSASKRDPPAFSAYVPPLDGIEAAASRIEGVDDLLVIGNGGSVTSLKGLRWLAPEWEGRLHILDTLDPSYLMRVKERIEGRSAHVLAVSKSGRNMNVLENLTLFKGIPTTVVTARRRSPLGAMAKGRGWDIVEVPDDVGGRFSAGTASALLPASVMGIDIASVSAGMGESYHRAKGGREVLELCGSLYLKERVGMRNLFIPVYSRAYSGFNDLVTQLMHETLSKDRKGLTALCFEGPEVQHHTNQRALDGPEDVMSLFVTVKGLKGPVVEWEEEVLFGDHSLNEIGGYTLDHAMSCEYEGVMGHMKEIRMPYARIDMEGQDARAFGNYIGLWHYIAYYSALLRNVNPFDQPAVEKAKEIGMGLRIGG